MVGRNLHGDLSTGFEFVEEEGDEKSINAFFGRGSSNRDG